MIDTYQTFTLSNLNLLTLSLTPRFCHYYRNWVGQGCLDPKELTKELKLTHQGNVVLNKPSSNGKKMHAEKKYRQLHFNILIKKMQHNFFLKCYYNFLRPHIFPLLINKMQNHVPIST